MNKLLVLTITLFTSFGMVHAQNNTSIEKCGTMEKLQKDFDYKNQVLEAEINANRWEAIHKNQPLREDEEYIIPVVVHVIYNSEDATQNIHDSIIQSQIDVLNEDFSRTNADAANTREIFDSIAVDTKIRFVFASKDPNGQPTTGITRNATEKDGFDVFFDGMESMKSSESGGVDAWPTNKYLNLWVCKLTYFGMEDALLGFAQFPSTMPQSEGAPATYVAETDGVVINYKHFGRTNFEPNAEDFLGRTCTHEVGHWLGLRHIWADEDQGGAGDCSQDDFVDDTPMANQRSNFDCSHGRNSCDNDAEYSNNFWTNNPPDMVENYMDYSNDGCMNMFSRGQTLRMHSFLNTARKELFEDTDNIANYQAFEVGVYPNPAKDHIQFTLPSEINSGTIEMVNMVGKVVYTDHFNTNSFQVKTSDMPNGVYMVNVEVNNAKVSKRMVVAH